VPRTKPSKQPRASPVLASASASAIALALLALTPAFSQAAVAGSMSISLPPAVTVGQGGVPASLTLINLNSGGEGTNTVCDAGAGGLCSGDPGIVLAASCGALDANRCEAADAGVFGFSAAGTGRAGTSCAGMTFTIDAADPFFGSVRFMPAGGQQVTLAQGGPQCAIDFAVNVLRSPSVDADPAQDGVQTAQAAEHTQRSELLVSPAKVRAASTTTVLRAPTTLVTTAPVSAPVGVALTASATVDGRVNADGGGTVDFRLHGPDDPACAREPVFTSLGVPYPPAGGSVSSAPFTPGATGTYRWSASYSGDVDHLPAATACGAPATLVGTGDRDRDGVADLVDQCLSTAGDKRNGCPSNLNADVRGMWRVNGLLSKLVSLTVRAPIGSRIEVRCKGPRGACSFKTKIVRKTTRSLTGLTRNFRSPRIFPADTRITVFVTKARRRGTYERLLTRSGRRLPSVANRCLNTRLQVQRCP